MDVKAAEWGRVYLKREELVVVRELHFGPPKRTSGGGDMATSAMFVSERYD